MVPEQGSGHHDLSLVLFVPFWLLLISFVGSLFLPHHEKRRSSSRLSPWPSFLWFYSPPLPSDLILSTTTFLIITHTELKHKYNSLAQIAFLISDLYSDCLLDIFIAHCLCPCCVCGFSFFSLSSTRTIISLPVFQGSAFSRWNLHPVLHTGQEAVWLSLSLNSNLRNLCWFLLMCLGVCSYTFPLWPKPPSSLTCTAARPVVSPPASAPDPLPCVLQLQSECTCQNTDQSISVSLSLPTH